MSRRLKITGIAGLPLVATLLVGVPSVAASSAQVPFVARITGVGGFSSPSSVYFQGSGIALVMGTVTDTGTATDFSPATTCPAGGINNLHTELLTAPDGSTLTIVSHDVACWVSPTRVYCTHCPYSVAVGTGRFADAAGSGELNGYLELSSGTFAGTYTGTISF
ncbi:MAG TPA: hypothetical protein VFN41_14785 [Candidatus Limnocylindrales bacterium]|nr:hypothetical protein [Candidatus Limnocylindrales bacterium]